MMYALPIEQLEKRDFFCNIIAVITSNSSKSISSFTVSTYTSYFSPSLTSSNTATTYFISDVFPIQLFINSIMEMKLKIIIDNHYHVYSGVYNTVYS